MKYLALVGIACLLAYHVGSNRARTTAPGPDVICRMDVSRVVQVNGTSYLYSSAASCTNGATLARRARVNVR